MNEKSVSLNNLNVQTSPELLSYIINVTPELRDNIDLPVQGQSIAPIGKIIMNNNRYKNAFLNTVNLIGLTVITRNHWENPWKKFTDKGQLSYGQQVREIICDIANVYDYNDQLQYEDNFVKTEVPNVLSYLHTINYQKFYKTTTSDAQMAMAFEQGDLFSLVDQIVNSLYEGMEYDDYLVNKYMLARRILDGTITSVQIADIENKTDRDVVAEMKGVSNDLTFRSPNYNPAGLRKATSFENQFAIVSTKFDAKFTTNVLATSYFRSDAEMKAQLELCDGFDNFDTGRLAQIFAKRDANNEIISDEYVDGYVPLTEEEITSLKTVISCIVGKDFFQDYYYGIDDASESTVKDFYNPQTLKRNHFLHKWGVISTSPFENAVVFTTEKPAVTTVSVTPSTISTSKHANLQFFADVETTGFANKAVKWSIEETGVTDNVHASINSAGLLTIPADYKGTSITVTATSIYDDTKSGDATVTIV